MGNGCPSTSLHFTDIHAPTSYHQDLPVTQDRLKFATTSPIAKREKGRTDPFLHSSSWNCRFWCSCCCTTGGTAFSFAHSIVDICMNLTVIFVMKLTALTLLSSASCVLSLPVISSRIPLRIAPPTLVRLPCVAFHATTTDVLQAMESTQQAGS
jgi:hypothetical protein